MIKRYSRLRRIEKKRARRSAFFYIVLTILLMVFLLFFGIGIFSGIANFISEFSDGKSSFVLVDTTPPAPPRIDAVDEYVSEDRLQITGVGEPGAIFVIDINGVQKEVVISSDGEFEITLNLKEGENTFVAWISDGAGNRSVETRKYTVFFDNEPPEISVTNPNSGSEFHGEEERLVSVEGKTEPDARVTVNGKLAVLTFEGKFSLKVGLNSGTNEIKIVAEDRAGNTSEESVEVVYFP